MNPGMTFCINEMITLAQYTTLHQRFAFLAQVPTLCTSNYEVSIQNLSKYPKRLFTRIVQKYRQMKLL